MSVITGDQLVSAAHQVNVALGLVGEPRNLGGRKPFDLTGQRFGNLIATERTANGARGSPRWLCKCDCGNTAIVKTGNLRSGKAKSCGCLRLAARPTRKLPCSTRIYPPGSLGSIIASIQQRTGYSQVAVGASLGLAHASSSRWASTARLPAQRELQMIRAVYPEAVAGLVAETPKQAPPKPKAPKQASKPFVLRPRTKRTAKEIERARPPLLPEPTPNTLSIHARMRAACDRARQVLAEIDAEPDEIEAPTLCPSPPEARTGG
jgi:hypothetical protein